MSKSEANRLIKAGACKLDGVTIRDRFIPADMVKDGSVIQVGRRFVKILNSDIRCVGCHDVLPETTEDFTCKCGTRYFKAKAPEVVTTPVRGSTRNSSTPKGRPDSSRLSTVSPKPNDGNWMSMYTTRPTLPTASLVSKTAETWLTASVCDLT